MISGALGTASRSRILPGPPVEQVEVVGLGREAVPGDDHVARDDERARVRDERRAAPERLPCSDLDRREVGVPALRLGRVGQVAGRDVQHPVDLPCPGHGLELASVRWTRERCQVVGVPERLRSSSCADDMPTSVDEEELPVLANGALQCRAVERTRRPRRRCRSLGRQSPGVAVPRRDENELRTTRRDVGRRCRETRRRHHHWLRNRACEREWCGQENDDDGEYHPHGRDDTDRHRSRLAGVIVNRDPKARGPYTAFADVAGAYERGRPGIRNQRFAG